MERPSIADTYTATAAKLVAEIREGPLKMGQQFRCLPFIQYWNYMQQHKIRVRICQCEALHP